jgi:hypothetical protein
LYQDSVFYITPLFFGFPLLFLFVGPLGRGGDNWIVILPYIDFFIIITFLFYIAFVPVWKILYLTVPWFCYAFILIKISSSTISETFAVWRPHSVRNKKRHCAGPFGSLCLLPACNCLWDYKLKFFKSVDDPLQSFFDKINNYRAFCYILT